MAATLNITFTHQPREAEALVVKAKYLNNSGSYNSVEMPIHFVLRRYRESECTIGSTLNQTAANYAMAIQADYRNYGGSGNIKAILNGPSVTIEVVADNWLFEDATSFANFFTYEIDNREPQQVKFAEFKGYRKEISNCESLAAIFNLTGGSSPYNAYIGGNKVVSDQVSPLIVNLERDATNTIRFTDSLGNDIRTLNVRTPRKIIPEDVRVSIVYTESGGSIFIDIKYISGYIKPYSYSLDGVNFQSENVFTGQPNGDYTIYIKDGFGCVTEKNITVDGSTTVTEITCEISDINPIRYSKVEGGKKNRYNTLSHEQPKNVPYPFIQYFTDKDNPITQLKTNAKYLNIFALDCEGGTTPLNPVKRSNHIGQELKTTGTKFSTEDGLLGVYFGVADVLDPLTNELIETKDYGYQVPYAFNKIDRLVTIDGVGTVPIDSITYDESYEAFVLLFNVSHTIGEMSTTIKTTYNIQNYEIYEFVTPISQLPESFNVVIEAGRSANDIKYTFISERIEKTRDSEDLTEIIYWNTTNLGGMNYATGVVHTLRLHGTLSRLSDLQTVAGYNGDVERYNTDNEIFDGEEFIFNYLSEEMVRKLRLILTHDRLFINGVLYRLGDDVPELNSRFTTNICELSVVLRKGGDLTGGLTKSIIEPATGEGVDTSTYELEQAIAAAKGKALILWKK